MKKQLYSLFICILTLLTGIFILTCSGCGSPSSNTSEITLTAESSFGKVGLLLRDSPSEEYENLFITITEVSLLPEGNDVDAITIFWCPDGYEIDLLQYQEEDFVLTIDDRIPVGEYDKIRLRISEIVAVGEGECANKEIKLPSGKIDLNPRAPFTVKERNTLFIRLDIDANKSTLLHEAGSSGKCIFRPVVFVDIFEGEEPQVCHHFFNGTIFELVYDDNDGETIGFILKRKNDALGNVTVYLDKEAVIINEDGEIAGPEYLAVDQEVTVTGKMNSAGDIIASVVVVGQVLNVKGQVLDDATPDDEKYSFHFLPDSGEEMIGEFTVELFDGTGILANCDSILSPQDIRAGMDAVVVGKYFAGAQVFKAVAILLKPHEICSTLTSFSIEAGSYKFTISDEQGDTQLNLPLDTRFSFAGEIEIPIDKLYLLECVNQENTYEVCVVYDEVLPEVRVTPQKIFGEVQRIDSNDRTLVAAENTVLVIPGTTILAITDDNTQVSFEEIEEGDSLELFGFSSCGNEDIDFYSFVVLIVEDLF